MKFAISLRIFAFLPVLFCLDVKLLRNKLIDMFDHGYQSYMKYAFPADELMPLSCKGRYRGSEQYRGDIDEVLGNFSMTLIDTMDTLAIMGKVNDFNEAIKFVIERVRFNSDVMVSVFEVNIRVLGGLLSAHYFAEFYKNFLKVNKLSWYNGELLLLAVDIGEKLLAAFNTSTGLPYPRINLVKRRNFSKFTSNSDFVTCTACAGTMLLEFGALSRLSGNPAFENKARRAMDTLWMKRNKQTNLIGTSINVENGNWHVSDSGIGAGIDSYYEYLLKGYLLFGDEDYLNRFNAHYNGIMKYVKNEYCYQSVKMDEPTRRTRNFMDSLHAFWPSLQVLIGDVKRAVELHEFLLQVIKKNTFLPEAFLPDMRAYWPYHFLRPEFVESTYFLYKVTEDPYYLKVGEMILENIEKYTRVKCGFAAISDVRTHELHDRMDSFVLSETFKYLYLLFEDANNLPFDIDSFILTTEAHVLPFGFSLLSNSSKKLNGKAGLSISFTLSEIIKDTDNFRLLNALAKARNFSGGENPISYLEHVREQVRSNKYQGFQSNRQFINTSLRLATFDGIDFRNRINQSILQRNGIMVLNSTDGQTQFLFSPATAKSVKHAAAGQKFMHEMKMLLNEYIIEQTSLSVKVIPLENIFDENSYMEGLLARFSPKLDEKLGVVGKLILANPFPACEVLDNESKSTGNIVIAIRGNCEFITKASNIQHCGAAAGIVTGASAQDDQLILMNGAGTDIEIPFVFVDYHDGQRLMQLSSADDVIFIGQSDQIIAITNKWILSHENFELNQRLEYYDKCSSTNLLWKTVSRICPVVLPEVYYLVLFRESMDSIKYSLPFGMNITCFLNGYRTVNITTSCETCSSYCFSVWASEVGSYLPLDSEFLTSLYQLFFIRYCGPSGFHLGPLLNVLSQNTKVEIVFRSDIPYKDKRVIFCKRSR